MRTERISHGWTVVAAAAVITCVGMGALFSMGIFLKPIEESMQWSRTGISAIALMNWIAMGLGSLVWGALSDRYGGRAVALAGGALLGLGMVLSSRVTALWQLYVTFGVVVGFAVGAFYAPLTATATKWFTARRGLAVSLVSAGIGLGVLLVSPLARWITSAGGWRTAMMVIGDLAWLVVLPAAMLVREPAHVERPARPVRGAVGSAGRDFSAAEVVRAPQFWAIALTHLACCAAHSGPIFHMVTHAIDQGLTAMVAATVLSVSGLASIGGRIATGVLADRFGAKQTLIAGLLLQAATIFLYLFVHTPGAFYALAAFFGFAYGGVMPVYALLTREYFGEKVMGTAYGGVFLISTLGMGLGSFAGGWVYDTLGSYAWLFASSTAIGGMAVVLATTFRAPRLVAVPVPVAGGR
jgi:MFS family permease